MKKKIDSAVKIFRSYRGFGPSVSYHLLSQIIYSVQIPMTLQVFPFANWLYFDFRDSLFLFPWNWIPQSHHELCSRPTPSASSSLLPHCQDQAHFLFNVHIMSICSGSCTKGPSVSHPYHLSNLANIILEQGCTTMKPVSLTWQGHWTQNSQQLWFSIEKKIKPSWRSGMNSEVPPQTEKYWLLVVANEFRDRFLAISLPW